MVDVGSKTRSRKVAPACEVHVKHFNGQGVPTVEQEFEEKHGAKKSRRGGPSKGYVIR